jgi:uncharacterized membrane protein
MEMNDYELQMNLGPAERKLSLVGGGAALFFALARPSVASLPLAVGGSFLLYRGLTGRDPIYDTLKIRQAEDGGPQRLVVSQAATINRPRDEVFAFWRRLENLPRFMHHLESVEQAGDGRSRWVARAPLGRTVEWEAEIVDERPDELIAWHSLPGSTIENSGRVEFVDAPRGLGTEVTIQFRYDPPAGAFGAAVASLFGEQPQMQVAMDLKRFKQIMEAGELATLEGQSSGRIKEVEEQRARLLRTPTRVLDTGAGEPAYATV